MNPEIIGAYIKKLRLESHMSQAEFGEIFHVSSQAVSKWERGLNLPDISILKEISDFYHITMNELLTGTTSLANETLITIHHKRKKGKYILGFLFILLLIFFLVFFLKEYKKNDEFEFKTIKTTCENFEAYGSIAYDSKKTSIYISNITYCGGDNNMKYKEINCTLYEVDNDTKTKIKNVLYNEKLITLEEFLKQVNFKIEHYSDSCKMYKKNGLFVEIKATQEDDKTVVYEIPLTLEENCN